MNDIAKNREYYIKKLGEYREKFAKLIGRIWKSSDVSDDSYVNEPVYKAALEFYRNFKVQPGIDYTPTIDYIRQLYDRYDKTDKTLDEKADSIIRYLGGGTAIITASALLSLKTDTLMNCVLGVVAIISLLPSVIQGVRAVRCAIDVRRPQSSAFLPDVKFAVEMAEYNVTKEVTEINLWLFFYPICEQMLIRNLNKSKLVESAHTCYRHAMLLLALPIVTMALTLFLRAIYLHYST